MKKRIYVILIFVILFVMLGCGKTYGARISFKGSKYYLKLYSNLIDSNNGVQTTDGVLNQLKKDYGYSGNYTRPIRISTTVEIIKKQKHILTNYYEVKLGNKTLKPDIVWTNWVGKLFSSNAEFTESDLINELGYEKKFGKLQQGLKWNVVIDATMPDTVTAAPRANDNQYYQYEITTTALYSGDEARERWGSHPYTGVITADYQGGTAQAVDSVVQGVDTATDKAEEVIDFLRHIKENVITGFANWLLSLGDGIQELANFAQTWTLGITELMHDPAEIKKIANGKADTGKGTVPTEAKGTITQTYENPFDDPLNINSYLNYEEIDIDSTNEENTPTTRFIGQNDIDGEPHNFTKKTPIPVISADIYTLAANKVDSIKTNFFERPDAENQRGIFGGVINFVASIIHAIMYIAAGLILTSMIWHGVGISKTSMNGNINEQTKHKLALRKLIIALILLFSVILLEALCIYLSEGILQDVGTNNSEHKYEGPIRVTVVTGKKGKKGIRFSTTPTGYVRYMAELDNINLYSKKLGYSALYLLMAIANCIFVIGMFVRSFILLLASIMGVALILVYVFKSKDASLVPFKQWFITYFTISLLQVALAIIARVMLEVIV